MDYQDTMNFGRKLNEIYLSITRSPIHIELITDLFWRFYEGGYTVGQVISHCNRRANEDVGCPIPPEPEPLPSLPRLKVSGKFFTLEDGTPFTVIEASDFNALGRFVNGENLVDIRDQRRLLGYNFIRVFTAYSVNGIGRLIPNDMMYRAIPEFLQYYAEAGIYVELVAFTGPYTELFANQEEMKEHWRKLVDICDKESNVLLERINEHDNSANLGSPDNLPRPLVTIASNGSACADARPKQPAWNYCCYHSNNLNEWWRKVGHNAMEFANICNHPCLSNENTRFPDRDNNVVHAYDAARGAALLCAGSCFHSIHGKSSELWDGRELECAIAWAEGALSVPLEFQRGNYHHRTDLESPGILRAYDRQLSNGRNFVVKIHV